MKNIILATDALDDEHNNDDAGDGDENASVNNADAVSHFRKSADESFTVNDCGRDKGDSDVTGKAFHSVSGMGDEMTMFAQ